MPTTSFHLTHTQVTSPAIAAGAAHQTRTPPLFASFWMGGFEGADHVNSHGVPLYMNRSNGHDQSFAQDYAAMASLGLRTVRESIGWRVGTSSTGTLDVHRLHALADAAQRHGLQVIWTLHHYGLPPGVDFFSNAFATQFADFCDQVARALQGRTDEPPLFQPINEISFLSWAAGSTNLIYPYLGESTQRGYELKCRLVAAALQGCDALWATHPKARMVHVDPLIHVAPDSDFLDAAEAEEWAMQAHAHTEAQFQAWDMLCGRREPHLGGAPRYLDVLGVNYYHDNQWLHPSGQRLPWHTGNVRRQDLSDLLKSVWKRYERPLFIAETGHVGAGRARWLDEVAMAAERALSQGVPLQGICLYPVLDRPDWEDPVRWHRSGLWEVRGHHHPPSTAHSGVVVPVCAADQELPAVIASSSATVPFPSGSGMEVMTRSLHVPLAQQLKRWQGRLPGQAAAAGASPPSHASPFSLDSPPNSNLEPLHSSFHPMLPAAPTTLIDSVGAHGNSADNTLIVFSHLRWDFVYQRPQHLLSRLARQMPVLFVEEPIPGATRATLEILDPAPNVRVLRAHVTSHGAGFSDAHTAQVQALLQSYLDEHAIARYWLWFYTPMALPLADTLEPQGIVYDCMDELAAFKFAPAELLAREDALFDQADLVFTGGFSLYEAKRLRHPDVHCFPSSVDAAHFGRAQQPGHADHVAQAHLPHPRLGYFGVIDERIDLELVAQIADARADWQVIMVGPVVKIDPALLPQRANLHWLGQRDYEELPEFVGGWDVCLMPFALNDSTRFISPTKTLEYLAAGRPVVSTPIRDVVTPYAGIVAIANTPQAFIAACNAALLRTEQDSAAQAAAVSTLLASTSWDRTASAMVELLNARRAAENSDWQGIAPTSSPSRTPSDASADLAPAAL